jgi:hypothetical protein
MIVLDGTSGITTPALENDGVTTVAPGSAAAPAITTDGDTNTGIFFPAADTIAFAEGGAEAMRIDSSGNLLVGTTSNSTSARIAVSGSGTGGAYLLRLASSATGAADADGLEFIFGDGVAKGSIRWNSTVTAYNTSSDYRLKENVAPLQNALDMVQQLNPVTYTWKVDGSAGQGFIAHELQAVCPDAVTGEKDAVDEEGNPQYQGVDTSFLVGILTAAIKELKSELDAAKARIEQLEQA